MPARRPKSTRQSSPSRDRPTTLKAVPASKRKGGARGAAAAAKARSATRSGASKAGAKARTLPSDWMLIVPLIAESLRRMKRDQYVVFACTGTNRFVQFAVGGPGRVRGEVVSDHFLDDDEQLTAVERKAIAGLGFTAPTHADDAPPARQVKDGSPNWFRDFHGPGAAQLAAVAAAEILAFAFKHEPADVRYHAFAQDGEELVLPVAGIQPEAEWLSPGFRPDDHDDLRQMVVETLEGTAIGTTRAAEGVDLVVEVGDRAVYVTAHDEPMSVLLYSVVGTADEGEETLATINDLNRSRNGCRAILYDGHLVVDRVLPGDPFVPRQLVEAVIEIIAWANTIATQGAEATPETAPDPALN